jgi:hypothetical protein
LGHVRFRHRHTTHITGYTHFEDAHHLHMWILRSVWVRIGLGLPRVKVRCLGHVRLLGQHLQPQGCKGRPVRVHGESNVILHSRLHLQFLIAGSRQQVPFVV